TNDCQSRVTDSPGRQMCQNAKPQPSHGCRGSGQQRLVLDPKAGGSTTENQRCGAPPEQGGKQRQECPEAGMSLWRHRGQRRKDGQRAVVDALRADRPADSEGKANASRESSRPENKVWHERQRQQHEEWATGPSTAQRTKCLNGVR